MIDFPNAKINIGLRITGKLSNGYHSLKSLMVPTGFCDILEFVPSRREKLELSGIKIPGNVEENILFKVLNLLRKMHNIPPLHIHLHKIIPTGAGLGGGSADAAFFLNMLNEFFKLGMDISLKEKIISKVGSDCTFFIRNQPALIKGTGNKTEPYDPNLKDLYLVIAYPGFPISTAEAYSGVKPKPENTALENLLKLDIYDWKDQIKNDFENTLFIIHPTLREIKEEFYRSGAVYASMSGSGSALYAIFEGKPKLSTKLEKKILFSDFF